MSAGDRERTLIPRQIEAQASRGLNVNRQIVTKQR
jgi:hypothetical protein